MHSPDVLWSEDTEKKTFTLRLLSGRAVDTFREDYPDVPVTVTLPQHEFETVFGYLWSLDLADREKLLELCPPLADW